MTIRVARGRRVHVFVVDGGLVVCFRALAHFRGPAINEASLAIVLVCAADFDFGVVRDWGRFHFVVLRFGALGCMPRLRVVGVVTFGLLVERGFRFVVGGGVYLCL